MPPICAIENYCVPFRTSPKRSLISAVRVHGSSGSLITKPVKTSENALVAASSLERAFRVFTEHFDRIKPREHNALAVDIEETVFEARVGGRIYDRGVDGSECHWARVLAIEPPNRIVFSWDISPRWQIEASVPAILPS